MTFSSEHLEHAVNTFASLPGIGRKTALRLALHLLQQSEDQVANFSSAFTDMKAGVRECTQCHNLSDNELCSICTDPRRLKNLICVVENVRQVMAIEETGQYRGLYHVLGGVISPIEGIDAEHLNISSLIDRVAGAEEDRRPEIIMAISPTIEGETTTYYISRQLADYNTKLSTIARGVSFGNDIEYADELTLSRSINARIPYSTNE